MTDVATKVGQIERAIVRLAELDDPNATAAAYILRRCLDGESFAAAAALPATFCRHVKIGNRTRALRELARLHTALDNQALAKELMPMIRREAASPSKTRPDQGPGLVWDLARTGVADLNIDYLRQLIRKAREENCRCNLHDSVSRSREQEV